MADALNQMIDDLRRHRPQPYDADAWGSWERAIVQAISALPPQERQWAAIVLVANDLLADMPGLSLAMAYGFLCGKVQTYQAQGVRG
jgi:hypothetical protein